MAALFCSRPVAVCFRSFPRAVSPIIATASFSRPASQTPRQTWTAEEQQQLMDMRRGGMTGKKTPRQTWTAEEQQQLMDMRQGGMTGKKTSEEHQMIQMITMRQSGLTWKKIAEEMGRGSVRRSPTVQVRRNSTTTTPPTPSPSPTPSSTTTPDETILTWDRFFKLRRTRRYINAGCSLLTAISTFLIAAPILAERDFDAWGAQISGLDPIIVMGVSSFALAAAGWLLGPTVGNSGFRIWAGRKGWSQEIARKEKSFYARIRKYRADASSSSPQNPIPDYYGEKVASVKDYRRWLKDQRAFNLKKNKNMI